MHENSGFNLLDYIPFLNQLPTHVGMSIVVSLALVGSTAVVRMQWIRLLSKDAERILISDASLTYRNFFEIVAESLYQLTELVIGVHHAPIYYPVIGTLFLFVFTSNLIGLVPVFSAPTENLNTTLALGVFVFVYYHYAGFKAHGVAYFKQFFGPVIWLAPLMFFIELSSHLFRPLSLAIRLRGNIMGDHLVLGVFSSLVPYFVPVIFYGLGVFVSFLQAFVFCLMTMVYISLATSHDH